MLKTAENCMLSSPFIPWCSLEQGCNICCMDHDGQLNIGNIKDSSIETLIHSKAARNLRASMLGDYPLPSVCQTCQAKPVKRTESA